jgi:uncharacterized membrane protein YdbT with pleckstrin-like domain
MSGYVESLLGDRENIIMVAHQHWFILVSAIVLEIVIILIIIALAVIAAANLPAFALLIGAIGMILLLLPLATMVRDIVDWMNRQYIITNRRVIQISGILNKNVTDSSLVKVTDVKMEQSATGRLFDYGDIEILTASELGANLFRRIDEPISFKTAMLNAKERIEQGEEGYKPDEGIPGLIASLDQLHQMGILSDEEFSKKKADLLERI